MRSVPPSLMHLNTRTLGLQLRALKVIELLGGGALLEEVGHWRRALGIADLYFLYMLSFLAMHWDQRPPRSATLLALYRDGLYCLEL